MPTTDEITRQVKQNEELAKRARDELRRKYEEQKRVVMSQIDLGKKQLEDIEKNLRSLAL